MKRFISDLDWLLTPGPERFTEPLFSIEVEEIAWYPPETVVQALLSLPGVLLDHSNKPTWWEWRAHWEALRITYPGIWLLSPDGEILKPSRFRQIYLIEHT